MQKPLQSIKIFDILKINLSTKTVVMGESFLSTQIGLIIAVLDQKSENKNLKKSGGIKKSVVIIKEK